MTSFRKHRQTMTDRLHEANLLEGRLRQERDKWKARAADHETALVARDATIADLLLMHQAARAVAEEQTVRADRAEAQTRDVTERSTTLASELVQQIIGLITAKSLAESMNTRLLDVGGRMRDVLPKAGAGPKLRAMWDTAINPRFGLCPSALTDDSVTGGVTVLCAHPAGHGAHHQDVDAKIMWVDEAADADAD